MVTPRVQCLDEFESVRAEVWLLSYVQYVITQEHVDEH